MKLQVRQKLVALADSYDVFDEHNLVAYTVKGEMGFSHKLQILDRHDRPVAMMKESTGVTKNKLQIYIGGELHGEITREGKFLKPQLNIDVNGWRIDGNFWGDYQVLNEEGKQIARIVQKHLRMTDQYDITIEDPDNALMVLMVVLAIEIARSNSGNG